MAGDATIGEALGVSAADRGRLKNRVYRLLGEQRVDEAHPLLEGLLALDPFDPWVLVAMATIAFDTHQLDFARRLVDRTLDVHAANVPARAMRAELRARADDVVGARADIALLSDADAAHPAVRRAQLVAEALNKGVAIDTLVPLGPARVLKPVALKSPPKTQKAPSKPLSPAAKRAAAAAPAPPPAPLSKAMAPKKSLTSPRPR